MNNVDWNLARAFHATAEAGSLSAAARVLGLSQPTLSRQVASLEEALGVTLFERIGRRLALTDVGRELLAHVGAMGEAADRLALAATGRSQAVDGFVSISASEGFAVHFLPGVMGAIRHAAPGITVEVIASNSLSDLRRREADIAIRHVPPEEPELIGKLIREASAHFYASREWVARHGHPRTARDAASHEFVGYDRDGRYREHLEAMGLSLDEKQVHVISENSLVAWEMVLRGLGIGVMMAEIGDATAGVVRVLEGLPEFTFPIWLVTHSELRTSRRIRVVWDILAEHLR